MEQKDNLIEVLKTIFRWKWPIIITTGVAAVGSVIISLVIPVYYESTAIFYAASPDLAMPERIFGTSSEAMEYYGEDEDIDRIMTIAKSSELAEFLIREFKLYEHYDIDTSHIKAPYRVREKLDDLYEVKKTKYDAIELSIEDQDPKIAAAMANAARQKIDELAQRLVKGSQEQVIKTYETNILEQSRMLNILNDSLEYVRGNYGVYNTVTQSEVLATLAAKAEARLANEEARLNSFQTVSRNVPADTIMYTKARISALKKEVANLNGKLRLFNKGMALADLLAQLHDEASEQLSEDQERYKQIKTAYLSYFPAIHLVEEAAVPIIKSRPKRMIIVLAATFIAFLMSIVSVLFLDTYSNVKWKEVFNAE